MHITDLLDSSPWRMQEVSSSIHPTAIVSPNIRIRYPEHFQVEKYSIIDDYCYFSTRIRIGRVCHINAHCHVLGGGDRTFLIKDYSALSPGVVVMCSSDDFVNDTINIMPREIGRIKTSVVGDVTMDECTGIGANSVIMPSNHIPVGVAIGALSFVPPNFSFKLWSVYAGIPIRYLCPRNRDSVLKEVEQAESYLRTKAKT